MWRMRLFALVIIIGSVGLIYINWQRVLSEGTYSLQIAALGPVGVVGGLFMLLFPQNAGKPETTMQKIIAVLVFVIGLAAGVYNWYCMDPGFFGL